MTMSSTPAAVVLAMIAFRSADSCGLSGMKENLFQFPCPKMCIHKYKVNFVTLVKHKFVKV